MWKDCTYLFSLGPFLFPCLRDRESFVSVFVRKRGRSLRYRFIFYVIFLPHDLGLSLTIPLAVLADWTLGKKGFHILYLFGMCFVFLGFLWINYSYTSSRSEENTSQQLDMGEDVSLEERLALSA